MVGINIDSNKIHWISLTIAENYQEQVTVISISHIVLYLQNQTVKSDSFNRCSLRSNSDSDLLVHRRTTQVISSASTIILFIDKMRAFTKCTEIMYIVCRALLVASDWATPYRLTAFHPDGTVEWVLPNSRWVSALYYWSNICLGLAKYGNRTRMRCLSTLISSRLVSFSLLISGFIS